MMKIQMWIPKQRKYLKLKVTLLMEK